MIVLFCTCPASMMFPWCVLWCSYDVSIRFLFGFYNVSIMFRMFLLCFHEVSMMVLLFSDRVSILSPWCFYHGSILFYFVPLMFLWCFFYVSLMSPLWFYYFDYLFLVCFYDVSTKFLWNADDVSIMYLLCFRDASMMFLFCFSYVSIMFLLSFWLGFHYVPMMILLCI